MSARRAPAPPPELDGYTFVEVLGTGGFADVFRYAQRMPRRQVAIKVLAGGTVSESARERFLAEADLMAQLSSHSSIVSIHDAGRSDDGRPFLVMQYCPLPNLAERLRVRALGVPEALGVGIRIAGAVETAHRAGIVHRDIKPANVLTTEYGRPALADFGIAGLLTPGRGEEAETTGVSVPWAAPEAVEGEPGGVAGDVYALGATIYTVLAGRSPFTVPGGPNTRLDYTQRIRTMPVPPIGREDVPASLTRVLEKAMAKQPERRYASALDLGRALQAVELELALPSTEIEVPDTAWMDQAAARHGATADVGGRTVVRKVVEVLPYVESPAADDGGGAQRAQGSRPGVSASGSVTGPIVGPAAPDAGVRRRRLLVAAAAALAVIVGVLIGYRFLGEATDAPPVVPSPGAGIPIPEQVASPEGLTGARSGDSVTFTWRPPEAVAGTDGVSYTWRRTEPGAPPQVRLVDGVTVTVEAPGQVCLAVKVRMPDGTTSTEPAAACVP
ncbi:MAG: serine/threonine-protein kinase [Georgenia sp.]